MSLPWSQNGLLVTRIPDITERAVTVKQLRQLSTFLQRLCKALLLRHTSDHSKQQGILGDYIGWYDINMYDITSEVITKIIPYIAPAIVEPHDVDYISQQQWCSWMEFVASRPQPAQIMISHWWGGRFRDFMEVIEALCIDHSLAGNTPIWICTFANNQWGENFGDSVAECPFVRAVAITHTTLLVVDRSAGSLHRTWCGLELHHTIETNKRLLIYTPSGRVGGPSGRASSGPLVEAIKSWDIRQSEASEDAYRRQILNFIADLDEFAGLKTSSDGQLLCTEGRPILDDVTLDKSVLRDGGTKHEYRHESQMFKQQAKVFEDLNMTVRVEVFANIGRRHTAKGCHLPHWEQRGIQLGQWRAFVRQASATFNKWRPTDAEWEASPDFHEREMPQRFEDGDTDFVYHYFLAPKIYSTKRSYMELVSDGPQTPKYYVNMAWRTRIGDVAAAIDWYAEAMHLSDSTVLFIDFLARGEKDSCEISPDLDLPCSMKFAAAGALIECQVLGSGVLQHWQW